MWQKKDNSLYRKFELDSFEEAIRFINRVAKIATKNNHHPKITNVYSIVELWLSTHSAGDKVTDKDRQFASEVDNIMDTSNTQLKLYTDGGSRGNPGPSAIGYVIYNMDDSVVEKAYKFIGKATNNQAEYIALKTGLEQCRKIGAKDVRVAMDSELVVNQMIGKYKVKNLELAPIFAEIKVLEKDFEKISYVHVRREQNQLADQLVNQALDDNIKH